MKLCYKLLVIVGMAFFLFGCSTTKMLTNHFNDNCNSLEYIHDSEIQPTKKNVVVSLDDVSLKNGGFADSTSVEKGSAGIFELLFLGKRDYNCHLGQNCIKENVTEFAYDSFWEESVRFGDYIISNQMENDSLKSEYDISLSLDSLSVSGPYTIITSSNGYVTYTVEEAGPAIAKTSLTLNLNRANEIIAQETIFAEEVTEFLKSKKSNSRGELVRNFSIAMTEALSKCLKKNITKAVKIVNFYIENNSTGTEIIANTQYEKMQEQAEKIRSDQDERKRSIRPGYYLFQINDGREFEAKICKIKGNKIIVAVSKTMITIYRKALVSIIDNDANNVTEELLAQKISNKVNYNNYDEFIEIK